MTRVIHTGDTHLGYQQYHSPERRRDFLDAFERVARDAIEDDVDAVVHAGDLFHDRRPDLPDLLGTLSVLRELDDAGVPFLAVVGNHETKRDAQWLDLFASLGLATRLGSEPVVVGSVAFYGLDFVPRSQRADLEYEFAPHDAEHAALVAHGLFQPFDYGEWDAAEVLSAASVDFDAMLLGDNHKPGVKQVDDGTWVTYCGSTERASADEREDRGYNIVAFDAGASEPVAITRRGLPTREFAFIDVDLAEGEGIDRVRERVDEYDLDGRVAIVAIEGSGETVSVAAVEERLREAGALVARVNDRRERVEEESVEVSFADPDDAVRERVREMGLSPAAREVDEVVRESKVADTSLTEEVERRVGELLAADEPGVFDPAPASSKVEPTAEATTAAERLDGASRSEADEGESPPSGDGDTTDTAATATPTDAESNPAGEDSPTEAEVAAGTDGATGAEADAESRTDGEADPGSEAETEAESEHDSGAATETDAGDRQADWGDFS
jgi:DNA repair exonuclease SbcCD nuclease subunit